MAREKLVKFFQNYFCYMITEKTLRTLILDAD